MVRGIDCLLIVILLEIVSGIAILLGAGIAAASGYLIYRNKRGRSANFASAFKVFPKVDERMDRIGKLIGMVGSRDGLIESYFQLKNDAVSLLDLAVSKDLTEREVIRSLKASSILTPVKNSLERIYATYERARFGFHQIAKGDIDLLLDDVRQVYDSLTEETFFKQRNRQ